jgi:hypothetical protein
MQSLLSRFVHRQAKFMPIFVSTITVAYAVQSGGERAEKKGAAFSPPPIPFATHVDHFDI